MSKPEEALTELACAAKWTSKHGAMPKLQSTIGTCQTHPRLWSAHVVLTCGWRGPRR